VGLDVVVMDVQSEANRGACSGSYADSNRFAIAVAVVGSPGGTHAGSSSHAGASGPAAVLGGGGGTYCQTEQDSSCDFTE
jgi:hypothetical protein